MNFARFTAPEPDSEHLFLPGKTYILDNVVRGVEIGDNAAILVGGRRVEVGFSDKRFRFSAESYAVWLGSGPRLGDTPGTVVLVDGVDEDGLYVAGKGFVQAKNLLLVDRLILLPGVWVMDRYNEKWSRIVVVDSSDAISVTINTAKRRPLSEFVFPVCGGRILDVPRVVCQDAFLAEEGLEEGKLYPLEQGWPGGAGTVVVTVEDSHEKALANRFLWENCKKSHEA